MTASRIVITAFVMLCAAAAFGQIPPPATPPDPNSPQQGQPAAGAPNGARDASLPAAKPNGDAKNGSEATEENGKKPLEGPEIVDDPNATPEQQASAEYAGPAVLSRGISAFGPMNPKNIQFLPSLGLEFGANSGLTGVAQTVNGKLPTGLASSVALSYGLTGARVMKRDTFSLNFSGGLYHYIQQSGYDGSSNQLSFSWTHKLSRQLSFSIRESLQEFNNNTLVLNGSQLVNSSVGTTLVTASPATEVFDGRVITSFSEGSLTWTISPRLSINFSGAGFLTRRASTSLYGDVGYQGGADVAYRVTRSTTLGGYYGYTHFDYIGIYGGSDVNTVGLSYAIAFNPYTQLSARVGGSRLESTGLSSAALDPVLQLLLGTPSTIVATYYKNYTPDISVQLRRKVSSVNLSAMYSRGITPGNGVILTSISQSFNLGVDYKLGRRWNMSGIAGYSNLSGYGTTNQKYASYIASADVFRKLFRNIDWHSRFYYNYYAFDTTGFLRNRFQFSTGIVWSPGDIMERLW